MTPKVKFHSDLHGLQDIEGGAIEVTSGDGHTVYLPIPDALDLRFGLLMRDLRQDRAGGLIGNFLLKLMPPSLASQLPQNMLMYIPTMFTIDPCVSWLASDEAGLFNTTL